MTKEKCPFQTEEEELWKKADKYVVTTGNNDCTIDAYIAGYHECQKEHEWHYADVPTSPINKVVLGYIKDYNSKKFCLVKWDGEWWYDARTWNDKVKLIAWCEIPKLPTELSKKWVDNYEDYQNASNDITFSQYPVYRGK